jgi:protein phosphatase
MKLRHSARTDVGKTRDHNEDSYGVGSGEQVERLGELLIVCDGMGGHAAGEVASRLAVDTILGMYYDDGSEDRPAALEQAFAEANARIYATGRGNMGTTGVAALLHHDALHIANVGDSRAYLIRNGEIRQISRDHSFVSDQVAAGLITADQARESPHRNVITRALGYQPEVSIDMFRLPLQVGDIVVLSSDGLHGLVSDAEIAEIASSYPPDEAVDRLIVLANQRGGSDNITVVIAHVDALDWDAQPILDQEPEDAHDRATAELPTQAAALEPASDQPSAPAPARPAPPLERRLTLLGGLLAMLLLTVLIFVILFTLSQPTVGSGTPAPLPTGAATPISSPAPARPTAPAPGPTLAPTASTVGPATAPTARPTPSSAPTSPATAPARTPSR